MESVHASLPRNALRARVGTEGQSVELPRLAPVEQALSGGFL